MEPKKIAIVGSGCAGLGAAYALRRTNHEVHIFEANDRYGGHTNTIPFRNGSMVTMADAGFIGFNTDTYPNFTAFLKALKVQTSPTVMTFGVSRDNGRFEYASKAIFAQWQNLFSRSMWRMLFDIIRFNYFAIDLLKEESIMKDDGLDLREQGDAKISISLGEYLAKEGYSQAFQDNYLVAMTAAVWSCPPDKCTLEFPALTLIRFMWNHHMLDVAGAKPEWLTVKGGAKNYVDAVLRDIPNDNKHLATPVHRLSNNAAGKVALETADGKKEIFDNVILATHGDQTLQIISESATEEEIRILENFKTTPNTAIIHSDDNVMPQRHSVWSGWNYMSTDSHAIPTQQQVSLTYYLNVLQSIPTATFSHCLLTLNPLSPPQPHLVQGTYTYNSPLYNNAAIRAQKLLPQIQNRRGIMYVGAWTRYGFHEDGVTSGIQMAMAELGGAVEWEIARPETTERNTPKLGWRDWIIRSILKAFQWVIIQWCQFEGRAMGGKRIEL